MWIALLRGVNVGGHTVKMDALRALFRDFGFRDVATFIASGNVIFEADAAADAAALEARIEAGLQLALGYAVATFVRTPAELAAVAARTGQDPAAALFAAEALAGEEMRVHVGFLKNAPGTRAESVLAPFRGPDDDFRVH